MNPFGLPENPKSCSIISAIKKNSKGANKAQFQPINSNFRGKKSAVSNSELSQASSFDFKISTSDTLTPTTSNSLPFSLKFSPRDSLFSNPSSVQQWLENYAVATSDEFKAAASKIVSDHDFAYEALCCAVKRNLFFEVKVLLELGVFPNANNLSLNNGDVFQLSEKLQPFNFSDFHSSFPSFTVSSKDPPLILAVNLNSLEMVNLLCENSAKIDCVSTSFESPLHLAVKKMSQPILEVLLKYAKIQQVPIDIFDSLGFTPLHRSAQINFVDGILLLLQNGSDAKKLTLSGDSTLCLYVNHSKFSYLMENMLDFDVDFDGPNGTPLQIAAKHKNSDFMLKLLNAGADINKRNSDGETALMIALRSGMHFKKSLEKIFKYNPNMSIVDNKCKSVLHHAAFGRKYYSDQSCLEFILSSEPNMNVNMKDSEGKTPLAYAIENESYQDVSCLLANGAQLSMLSMKLINKAFNFGCKTDFEIAVLALEAGADWKMIDSKGYSSIHHASSAVIGSLKLVKMLIGLGVDIDSQTENGDNALHLALESQNLNVAVLLLELSPKLAAVANTDGKFPMQFWGKSVIRGKENREISLILNATPPTIAFIIIDAITRNSKIEETSMEISFEKVISTENFLQKNFKLLDWENRHGNMMWRIGIRKERRKFLWVWKEIAKIAIPIEVQIFVMNWYTSKSITFGDMETLWKKEFSAFD
ncbi:hypothetical protein HK096_003888 [Nowakowskiella sp. JEL0078]|nr:hypothetical protein HK096_003888 [Nowakowskiella sp. JEL0078]